MSTCRTIRIVVFCLVAGPAVAVNIETVLVGNPGNAADLRYNLDQRPEGFGRVDYSYNIGKYEVTAGQYCEFLNAVAGVDLYGLYNPNMWNSSHGCKIERTGGGTVANPYSYAVAAEWANRPANYVGWGDAARFANWLHNGQPTGAQDLSTTESGAYHLNGAVTDADLLTVSRESNWTWAIPTEDEWYKAAYHKNDGVTGNYFGYPTRSDTMPSNELTDPDPGNNATFYESSNTIGSPYYRTEAGAHENSESPYETFDMGGNVWEWNEAVIGSSLGMRGGAFYYDGSHLHASSRLGGSPASAGIGFRVVQVPEPGCIALTGAAVLLLPMRRRQVRGGCSPASRSVSDDCVRRQSDWCRRCDMTSRSSRRRCDVQRDALPPAQVTGHS